MLKKTMCLTLAIALAIALTPNTNVQATAATSIPVSAIEFHPATVSDYFQIGISGSFTVNETITDILIKWEYTDPSINDFVMTPVAGAVYVIDAEGNSQPLNVNEDAPGYNPPPHPHTRTQTGHFANIAIPAGSTISMKNIMRYASGINITNPLRISITTNGIKIYEWVGRMAFPPGNPTETVSEWSILNDTRNLESGQYLDTDGHWAEDYIEKLELRRRANYETDDNAKFFDPDAAIKRIDFVKWLAQTAGEPIDISTTNLSSPFSDVDPASEDAAYVRWAYDNNVTSGAVDETGALVFRPEDTITRQDAAAMIGGYIDQKGILLPVSAPEPPVLQDSASIDSYAIDYVIALQSAGIISGYADGTFQPQNTVSRAETAKILWTLYEDRIIGQKATPTGGRFLKLR